MLCTLLGLKRAEDNPATCRLNDFSRSKMKRKNCHFTPHFLPQGSANGRTSLAAADLG